MNIIIESILNDLEYNKTEQNNNLVLLTINNTKQDIYQIWDKIPSLLLKLKHVKGYISVSNSLNKFKISIDNNVSNEVNKEFIDIVRKWSNKYNIDLEYDFNKDNFYII